MSLSRLAFESQIILCGVLSEDILLLWIAFGRTQQTRLYYLRSTWIMIMIPKFLFGKFVVTFAVYIVY